VEPRKIAHVGLFLWLIFVVEKEGGFHIQLGFGFHHFFSCFDFCCFVGWYGVLESGEYAEPGEVFNFWELQARALHREEIVIAHKCAANGSNWSLNPPNKDQVLNWGEGDQVLVLTRPST
jgi:hypothetical protein